MKMERDKQVTRFEVILGALVIAALGLAVVPLLRGDNSTGGARKATASAEIIARAAWDYRLETGDWPPRDAGGGLDRTCLTGPGVAMADQTAMVGALGYGGDVRPWLDEIPLDPWYRPFRVHLVGEAGNQRLVVISAGRDGTYQTSTARLLALIAEPQPAFGGDDTGFVLDAGDAP